MNILIYTHGFAPKIGGVETYIMLLALGLAQPSQQIEGCHLQVTLATPTPAGNWDDATLPYRVVRQPGLVMLLRLISSADVIHLAGPSFLPMLLGLLLKKPVVVEHSGYQACCPNGLLLDERTKTVCSGHFMARRYVECLRCNATNVGLGKSMAMLLLTFPRRWLLGRVTRNVYPSNHIGRRVTLPRGVNIYHGTPDPPPGLAQQGPKYGSGPACFAFVGRLVPEKGVSVLLRAGEMLTGQGYDFRLKIIGDGPERAALEELTDHYGLRPRTTFTGTLRGGALQGVLGDSVASVMPSTWEDVAPVAAIEHMIHGRLLIASDIGGLGELVGDAGLKFPPGEAEGLAFCLRRVLNEPNLPKMLGEKAQQRALRLFRAERMVADHLALYCGMAVNPNQETVEAGK